MSAARASDKGRKPPGTLLVDIGNTRAKWASLTEGRIGRQKFAVHEGWTGADIASHILRSLSSAASKQIGRVVVVSVAGARIDRGFSLEVRRHIGIAPEFFASRRRAGGVTTLYVEPWRLGADRFVGVIGAFQLSKHQPVCVVSVGTAMTLDVVDARGRHRGGAIIPAPALMISSLLSETHGIRRRARGGSGGNGLFARSTRSAIAQGARYAAAAAADRAVEEARHALGSKPLVLLTGGAAPTIQKLIRSRHRHVPDLVLQGLAVIADGYPKDL
jgi:type III pantothenate kinase